MSENKIKGVSGCFVICDVQEEYSDHLFQILSEQFEGEYQFHLFHDLQKMTGFFAKNSAEILVIGEEYGNEAIQKAGALQKFILTGSPGEREDLGNIPLFRYQSAEGMIKMIRKYAGRGRRGSGGSGTEKSGVADRNGMIRSREGESVCEKRRTARIRDDPPVRGMIGIYSPVHRIGKTRFALRLGQKAACRVPVLYLNLEGCSGGRYYFQEGADKDLGDLLYFLKQERDDWGLKLSAMAARKNGMDYILPMRNEQDLRSVSGEEWIRLLDMILEKCIYEVVILDLGDLLYFLKQERDDWGLKLSAMAARKNGMDYILPMRNEQDLRSVSGEEWIRLLDMILEKCIYEVVILDLGDAVSGLYDILRKCERIYTPYICEGAAEAKLEQYEESLRAAGYADILAKTVKKRVGKGNRYPERSEETDEKNGTAV